MDKDGKVLEVKEEITKAPVKEVVRVGVKKAPVPPKSKPKAIPEIVTVPFETEFIEDGTLEEGVTVVVTEGVNGEKLVFTIVAEDGKVLEVKEEITKEPVKKVVRVGIKKSTGVPSENKPQRDLNTWGSRPTSGEQTKQQTAGAETEVKEAAKESNAKKLPNTGLTATSTLALGALGLLGVAFLARKKRN